MSLFDNAELHELDTTTWKYKVEGIVNEGEAAYLDNGGCLTHEQRDALFVKMEKLASQMAEKLDKLGDKP